MPIAISLINRAAGATVNGAFGSWLAAAPASNLANDNLAKTARSTDAANASTKLRLDLGAAYPIGVVAFVNSNTSSAGQLRVKAGTSAGDSSLFSGSAVAAYGASIEGINGRSHHAMQVLSAGANVTARYWDVEVLDAANAAGYWEAALLFMGELIVPQVNAEYGAYADQWMPLSEVSYSYSGAPWKRRVRNLRTPTFTLPALTAAEAATLWDREGLAGITEEVLFLPDPTDAAACTRWGTVGLATELSPLENPEWQRRGKAYAVRQL